MRIVFAGTPHAAVPSLERLIASDRHDVVAVITRPDAVAGRGRQLVRSPVGALADEHSIDVLAPRSASDPAFVAELSRFAPDCCPVVAYGALLPRTVLDVPKLGWVNLHFSLLPAWRGAAPVQAAIAAGDDVTGATTFVLDEGMDTGPVLGAYTERIRPTDTAGDLLGRLAVSGGELLESTLDALQDGAVRAVPQPSHGVSRATKVTVDSARVDWTKSAMTIDRHVRSVTPAPGAWTTLGDVRIKLGPVLLREGIDRALEPGALAVSRSEVLVGTGSGDVALTWVQPQGKKAMTALDWARGARVGDAAVFA